jgi:hypothetical protein
MAFDLLYQESRDLTARSRSSRRVDGRGGPLATADLRGGPVMIQLTWRASLVVVLLLLASVGTASAECAWVLWSRDSLLSGDEAWGIISAFSREDGGKAECERFKDGGTKRTREGASALRFLCLPDTIDPRGPKGR